MWNLPVANFACPAVVVLRALGLRDELAVGAPTLPPNALLVGGVVASVACPAVVVLLALGLRDESAVGARTRPPNALLVGKVVSSVAFSAVVVLARCDHDGCKCYRGGTQCSKASASIFTLPTVLRAVFEYKAFSADRACGALSCAAICVRLY